MDSPPTPPKLILASASPRRQQLLREAGYEFTVHPAEIDESKYPSTFLPAEIAGYLAGAKAAAIAPLFPDDVTLAADTVVAFGDQAIGKPRDQADARRILELLSGTTHIVITGVSIKCPAMSIDSTRVVMSAVRMKNLSAREIERYLTTGDWEGKAGAYGIQDNDPFVTRVAGSASNIVGLPMRMVKKLLTDVGVPRQKISQAPDAHPG